MITQQRSRKNNDQNSKVSPEKNPADTCSKFLIGSSVVYPKHGVGTVVGVQQSTIGDTVIGMLTIRFERDRMTIQVPVEKMTESGVRKVASLKEMGQALQTLLQKRKVCRKLWSRRAQEYETKINSGEITALAEVVRDLFRKVDHVNQSYSERQLYQLALERLAREVAAVRNVDERTAAQELETMMFEGQEQINENEPLDTTNSSNSEENFAVA